jgi:basic membrane protein A
MKSGQWKWLALLMVLVLALAACGNGSKSGQSASPSPSASSGSSSGGPSPSGGTGGGSEGPALNVAMVTSGSLGDNGIFDLAAEGLSQAEKDFGITYKVLEGKQDPSLFMNLLQTAASGYDLVFVNPGYQFEETLRRVAPQYPDKIFVYMDGVSDLGLDNVVYMTTKDNEGSYLAGMLAAGMTVQTGTNGINAERVIGAVGAIDAPTINNFIAGYKQGAATIVGDIDVKVLYAGAFDNPAKGQELALTLYNQNADVVYNVAALTGTGVLQAAERTDRYAIGVDVNQCDVQPGHILASMMKRFDSTTYLMVEKALNNELGNGNVYSFGLGDNGVELLMCPQTADIVPDDLVKKIEEARQNIVNGVIEVDQVKE